jgi:pimeloyl-ACP methyl ester carboxylesterase
VSRQRIQLDDGSWVWRYDRRGRGHEAVTEDEDADALRPEAVALWDRVAEVQAPMLLVRGSLSPVVDDADVAALLERQPAAEVVVVEGAGHSVQGDRPIELAGLVERFVLAGA